MKTHQTPNTSNIEIILAFELAWKSTRKSAWERKKGSKQNKNKNK
jgi:hypothetical protein